MKTSTFTPAVISAFFGASADAVFGLIRSKRMKKGYLLILVAFLACSGSVAGQTVVCPPTDMVSWWDGDAVSGSTAIDIRSTNDGNFLNGATTASGQVGVAFSFDGINDYISIPEQPDLEITGPMTLDAWIKTPGTGYKLAGIVGKMPAYYYNGNLRPGYLISVDAAGKFRCDFIRNIVISQGVPLQGTAISTTTVTDNVFHHVAATYDGSHVRVYVDGVLEAVEPYSDGVGLNDEPVRIGFEPNAYLGARYFRGLIDEVGIYNRTLSDAEIQAIYDAGSAGKCKTCIGDPKITCYLDGDNDGFGDPNSPQEFCEACGTGYVLDNTDNCPSTPNPTQFDLDADGLGDACDASNPINTVVNDLNTYIEGLGLVSGIENALVRRLNQAASKFCNFNNPNSAIAQLNSIISYVQFQSGNQIPVADAAYITAQLQALMAAIQAGTVNCGSSNALAPPSGISSQVTDAASSEFTLYPNPTTGALTLQLPAYLEQEVNITIHDAFGRRVYAQMEGSLKAPSIYLNLNEQPLPNGVYFLSVQTEGERQVKQFVLAR